MSDLSMFGEVVPILFADVKEAKQRMDAEDSQFNRRNYVRAVFAALDGSSFGLRNVALKLQTERRIEDLKRFAVELAALLEVSPKIAATGAIRAEPSRISFLPHFAFVLRILATNASINCDFFGDHRWESLRQSLAIRHRITHPKERMALEISDSDLETIREARGWVSFVLRAIADGLETQENDAAKVVG